MAFITDKEELKSGLIIFRRGDVAHRNFYCRIKLPKEDRYKTISLHTADRESARARAFDQDADIRFRVKHDVAVFNRPFRQVAEEYLQTQQRRANTGEVSHDRVKISETPSRRRSKIMSAAPRFTLSVRTAGLGIRHGGGKMAKADSASISAMRQLRLRWERSTR